MLQLAHLEVAQRTSVAPGRFLGGPGHRAQAHTRLAVPKKCLEPRRHPLFGAPEISPVQSHARPNRSARDGQLKCDPGTGESHAVKSVSFICQCLLQARLDIGQKPESWLVGIKGGGGRERARTMLVYVQREPDEPKPVKRSQKCSSPTRR